MYIQQFFVNILQYYCLRDLKCIIILLPPSSFVECIAYSILYFIVLLLLLGSKRQYNPEISCIPKIRIQSQSTHIKLCRNSKSSVVVCYSIHSLCVCVSVYNLGIHHVLCPFQVFSQSFTASFAIYTVASG